MMGFATDGFLTGLGVTAAVELVAFGSSWLIALRLGRFNVVDTTWGASFVAVAVTGYLWSAGTGADTLRRSLALALTSVWGLRLAGHLGWRSRGRGEDPRYARMLRRANGAPGRYALFHIFLLQAMVAWFVSLPIQASMVERAPAGVFTVLGAAVTTVGVFFEAVGDAQLAVFKRSPANTGQVMDAGLWHYTRHPNYFGDVCVWVGLWLVAAQQWLGAATVLSVVLMVYLLAAKTGKPLLERALLDQKPGYRSYVARTSGFFPLPPKAERTR